MTLNHTNLLNARLAIRQMADTLKANILANNSKLAFLRARPILKGNTTTTPKI